MLKRQQITALLPHGPSMCLLDSVDRHDHNGIICRARIDDGHPLRRQGEISSIISLEYGAQACGLWAALRHHATEKPTEGYVLAVRNFQLHRTTMPENETLLVRAEKKLLGEDSAVCLFSVSGETGPVAEGQLTLMMKPA